MSSVDKSIQASFRLLIARTYTHWGLWVSGAVSSSLSWIFGSHPIRSQILLYVGLALLLCAVVKAFHDVRIERDTALQRFISAFEVDDKGYGSYLAGVDASGKQFQS